MDSHRNWSERLESVLQSLLRGSIPALALSAALVVVVAVLVGRISLVARRPLTTAAAAAAANPAPAVPTAPPSARAAASRPPADVENAIKQVVQQANSQQESAFAAHDPTVMRNGVTPAYYNELAGIQQDMQANGVTAIHLVSLQWGTITVQGSTAHATTVETWQTTYNDGGSDRSQDRNVYTLVQQGGAWVVQADDHPDAAGSGSNPTAPGVPGLPGSPSSPGTPRTIVPGPGQSQNWAGYSATGGTFTSVSGTWTVPQVTGAAGSAEATWVGIGGVDSRDLIQAGTGTTVGRAGQVHYEAWIETLPQAADTIPLTVSPGDTVTVNLTQLSAGQWQIRMENTTTGQHYETNVAYNSSLSSAEWVEEAPVSGRRVATLDDFGSVAFRSANAVEDGHQVSISAAGGQPITMIDRSGQTVATTSQLSGDGSGFTVTRA